MNAGIYKENRQASPHPAWAESLESFGFDDWSRTLAGCRHVSEYGTGHSVKPLKKSMVQVILLNYYNKKSLGKVILLNHYKTSMAQDILLNHSLADCVYFQILEENELFVPSDDDDDD